MDRKNYMWMKSKKVNCGRYLGEERDRNGQNAHAYKQVVTGKKMRHGRYVFSDLTGQQWLCLGDQGRANIDLNTDHLWKCYQGGVKQLIFVHTLLGMQYKVAQETCLIVQRKT